MPALWKSLNGKDKSGYSSNPKSQFEMMGSENKNSRNATRNLDTIYYNKDADSDENNLISSGPAYVTTNIRAGDEEADRSSAGADSGRRKRSVDDSRIVRTVEVRQYRGD